MRREERERERESTERGGIERDRQERIDQGPVRKRKLLS